MTVNNASIIAGATNELDRALAAPSKVVGVALAPALVLSPEAEAEPDPELKPTLELELEPEPAPALVVDSEVLVALDESEVVDAVSVAVLVDEPPVVEDKVVSELVPLEALTLWYEPLVSVYL